MKVIERMENRGREGRKIHRERERNREGFIEKREKERKYIERKRLKR